MSAAGVLRLKLVYINNDRVGRQPGSDLEQILPAGVAK